MEADGYTELLSDVDPRVVIQAEKRPGSDPVEANRQIPRNALTAVRAIKGRRELCATFVIAIVGVGKLDSRGKDGS